ncbi:MAG TPA: glycoside hydrolase family 15 protein [Bacillota bacterium]|nr:glycoside hydrolase family 15 protein [Bacillota bacterium]
MHLVDRSIRIILDHQSHTGAFPASPTFTHYRYCWLRDGAFIAYSMDLKGHHDRSRAFYKWCHRTIERYRGKAESLLAMRLGSEEPSSDSWLHTRFTLQGIESTEPWGNHQLDGYGTYLWGVAQHTKKTDISTLVKISSSLVLVLDYLHAFWKVPCYDCWEEFENDIHPSTLAAIYGGVQAICPLLKQAGIISTGDEAHYLQWLREIKEFVFQFYITDGHFVKKNGTNQLDANLLFLAIPYRLISPHYPVMKKTIAKIEKSLVCNGGVHRYLTDSYYGGGEWILLSAWLGWYYADIGECNRAHELLTWIESYSTDGNLPEQILHHVFYPEKLENWIQNWGEIASPLLWSHAMYLILHDKLKSPNS